jgi:hypothetical protein
MNGWHWQQYLIAWILFWSVVTAVVSLFMKGETYTSNYRDKFLGKMMVGV